jgi:SAM-dependent methyltransferase
MTDDAVPGSEGNAAQIAYWNDRAADNWTALQERLDKVFTPLTAAALEAASPQAGERVIDIGCGCGATVLELARRVGPNGHVRGLDISVPMAARAQERIAAAGFDNAEVLVSDASTHAFPQGETDLLFSRFGVMFFADPAGAFANLRRAMRPGARMLCAVWRPMVENSWFTVPLEAARPLLPPQPAPDPLAPGPFAFSNQDRVHAVMQQAGWRDIDMQKRDVPMPIAGPGEVAEAADFATRLGALARILGELEPDLRPRVAELVLEAMRGHDGPNGITLGGAIWLVSARA